MLSTLVGQWYTVSTHICRHCLHLRHSVYIVYTCRYILNVYVGMFSTLVEQWYTVSIDVCRHIVYTLDTLSKLPTLVDTFFTYM